ncbi:ribosome maturation factor RimM [Bryobacter aggregatus]|uniref:ribosome maturation factor RimM n=1 Tax=Bryobacter aggregatus TaxID=360054 RepID=UPI0004E23E5E|nr:ribosome maturation factor RimM [Bryobacter aggregatus]
MIPEGWLTLATILKPRGNKGEVLVNLLTDDIERLLEVESVSCFEGNGKEPKVFEVEEAWMHQDKAIVKLAGIDSINDADTLRGLDLCIPLGERRELREGEVFLSDLIGCQIFDRADVLLGTVADVYEEGSQVWLSMGPDEVLIPWIPAFFPVQDIPKKRLVAELPDGLLEVNQQ